MCMCMCMYVCVCVCLGRQPFNVRLGRSANGFFALAFLYYHNEFSHDEQLAADLRCIVCETVSANHCCCHCCIRVVVVVCHVCIIHILSTFVKPHRHIFGMES